MERVASKEEVRQAARRGAPRGQAHRARAHDGRAARRAPVARARGVRARRLRGRLDLREPDAVRPGRGLRGVPARPRARHRRCSAPRASTSSSRPRPRRCTPPTPQVTVEPGPARRAAGRARSGPAHFARRVHGRRQALQHRAARPRVLRREGLPAARGRPAHGARPRPRRCRSSACPIVRERDGLALSSRNVVPLAPRSAPRPPCSTARSQPRETLALGGERDARVARDAMRERDRERAARRARLRGGRRPGHARAARRRSTGPRARSSRRASARRG